MKKNLFVFIIMILGSGIIKSQCTASFTYYADPANDGNIMFHDTSASASLVNYYWDFGDGSSAYWNNPSHTYNASGHYYACLTIQDSLGGCTFTYCDSVIVVNTHPYCHAEFYYSWDSLGYSYLSDNSVGYMLSYAWDFGDGTTGNTSGSQAHLYPGPGVYTACLTVTNAGATCSSSFCDTFTITSCHANFTYAFDSLGNGCNFTSVSTGTANNYYWDFGDGSTSTLANPYHVFATNGWFYVHLSTYSTTDSTCSDSHAEYVYAHFLCDATFSIAQDSLNPFNYLVYLYNYGSPATNYLWDFGDGTTSTAAYPTHTFPGTAAYNVCLTVSDASGCTDNYCDTINGGHGSSAITMTVVPPMATGFTEIVNETASLENYPNPFSQSTTIKYSVSGDAFVELNVVDLLGNKIASLENNRKSSGNYSIQWNSENVSSGMYLLQMKVNEKITTKKIVISK